MRIFILALAVCTTLTFADNNSTKDKEYILHIEASKNLDKDSIAKAIGEKEQNIMNFWSKERIITKEFVDNIDSTLKGYLENIGYFNAKIDLKVNNNSVDVAINEGRAIRVKAIDISSNFKLKQIIDWKRDDIFSSDRFDTIKSKINKKLLENGYCNAKVDTKAYVDLKQFSAKLNYKIDKGELCFFGKIIIKKSPLDIKKEVIYSRVKYKEGELFDIRKIEESYTSLSALNTFANVQIKYDLDKKSRYVDSTITLDKKDKLRRYLIGLGVDSEVGLRAKMLWEKRDFLGNAKKITIKSKISKDNQDINVELFTPSFISYNNIYTDLYLIAGYSLEETNAYRDKEAYIKSYLDYNYKNFNVKLGLALENLDIKLKDNYEAKIGGVFNILYPYITLIYDNRDSRIDPKNGYYVKLYGEYGLSCGNSGVEYFKYLVEGRAIKSFNDLTLSAVGKFGTIHEKSSYLPASKLFYGGGLFSNRAYGKDKIGAVINSKSFSALGGKSFLNLQLEANYKIHKRFYGALFFDSTMISKDEYNFKGKRVDTLGVGLRYKSPIGPIKIDFGVNVHNRKDYAISIMLGQSFWKNYSIF